MFNNRKMRQNPLNNRLELRSHVFVLVKHRQFLIGSRKFKKKKTLLHFVYFFHGGSMGGLVLPCPAESTSILFSKLNRIASQQEFPPQTTGNVLHRVVQSGASPNVHRLNVWTLPQRSRPTLTHSHTHLYSRLPTLHIPAPGRFAVHCF